MIKLPSISLIITEKKQITELIKKIKSYLKHSRTKKTISYSSVILTLILIVLLSGFTIFLGFRLSQSLLSYTYISGQKEQINGKINFWKSIAQKYDGYPLAYLNIAALYYQLSDFNSSRVYLNKALLFNPDYVEAKMFDKKLKLKGF